MPRDSSDANNPDLFEEVPRPREPHSAKLAKRAVPKVILPTDLEASLALLSDADLERLGAALAQELARRGAAPPPETMAPTSSGPERRSPKAAQVTGPAVAAGKANAIRAAFQAGLKPAAIARQFGVPQALVREVLQGRKS